eukprot:gene1923-1063_t
MSLNAEKTKLLSNEGYLAAEIVDEDSDEEYMYMRPVSHISVDSSISQKKKNILSVLQIEKELLTQLQYWRNCFTCSCCCTGILLFITFIGYFIYFFFSHPLLFVSQIQVSSLRERDRNTTISLRFLFESKNFNLIPISIEKINGKLLVLDANDPVISYDLGKVFNLTKRDISTGNNRFNLLQYLDCGLNYQKVRGLILNFQHALSFKGHFEYKILFFDFMYKFEFYQPCANGCNENNNKKLLF